MIWHDHSKLVGEHAFLGASKYHWLNYTDDQMIAKYKSSYTQAVGTYLHELAAGLIENHMKLSKSDSKLLTYHLLSHGVPRGVFNVDDLFGNFRNYVNDAISYRMSPEQVLYYAPTCFGTTDAISFYQNRVRIHDLKTGTTPAHMEQLLIYAALFCLEYENDIKRMNLDLNKLDFELRIYQSEDVIAINPTLDDIRPIMDKIVAGVNLVEEIKKLEA